MQKKIMGSRSVFAADSTRFGVTNDNKISEMPVASSMLGVEMSEAVEIPMPGRMRFTRTNPIMAATTVVVTFWDSVITYPCSES